MKELILVIEDRYLPALGTIRGIPGLKVAIDRGCIWLRGIMTADRQNVLINSLPVITSYELDAENRLFPTGGLTPTGILKQLDWQPVKAFIPVTMPVSALPGNSTDKMPLRLSRSEREHEAYALLTDLADWKVYADTAPFTRLKQLSFAVSQSGKTLITGQPLPIIKGQSFWLNGQMLLPAGYDFNPPVIVSLLNGQLNKDKQALLLFSEDGSYQQVPLTDFVPAKRSAVRLTQVG